MKPLRFNLIDEKPNMIVPNYSQGWESHASDVDRRSWDVQLMAIFLSTSR